MVHKVEHRTCHALVRILQTATNGGIAHGVHREQHAHRFHSHHGVFVVEKLEHRAQVVVALLANDQIAQQAEQVAGEEPGRAVQSADQRKPQRFAETAQAFEDQLTRLTRLRSLQCLEQRVCHRNVHRTEQCARCRLVHRIFLQQLAYRLWRHDAGAEESGARGRAGFVEPGEQQRQMSTLDDRRRGGQRIVAHDVDLERHLHHARRFRQARLILGHTLTHRPDGAVVHQRDAIEQADMLVRIRITEHPSVNQLFRRVAERGVGDTLPLVHRMLRQLRHQPQQVMRQLLFRCARGHLQPVAHRQHRQHVHHLQHEFLLFGALPESADDRREGGITKLRDHAVQSFTDACAKFRRRLRALRGEIHQRHCGPARELRL